MSMEFEGPGETQVIYIKDLKEGGLMSVSNRNWTSKKDEQYHVSFHLNGNSYGDGANVGIEIAGKKGFLSRMSEDFERDFGAGESLHVYLNDQIIDRLSLGGSAAGLESLRRCVNVVRREEAAAARERARWSDLPSNPFAEPGAPQPRGNPGSWANSNDYPSAALRELREGVSRFLIRVGSDGIVRSCEITETSGSPDLDATTCTLIMRRARFQPAHDAGGNPVEGEWRSAVRWEIPVAPLSPPGPITCVAGQVCTRE